MKQYHTFKDFYPFYLSQHQNNLCRRLHFAGTLLACIFFLLFVFTLNLWYLLLVPVCGYSFAWVGHFFFEKNKPATFQYPLYSLLGDLVLFKDTILKIKYKFTKHNSKN